jgi:hypothetical protein
LGCEDSDNGAADSSGDTCEDYAKHPTWCGNYDDSDFSSADMCCACEITSTVTPPHAHDWFFQDPADCPSLAVPGSGEDFGEWPFSGMRCTSPFLQAGDYCQADGECGTDDGLKNLVGYNIYRVVSMPTSPSARPAGCVPPRSLGQCAPCLSSDQCAEGYCCPTKKQCVGVRNCIPPFADCEPAAGEFAEEGQCHPKRSWTEALEGVVYPTSAGDVGGARGLWQHPTCEEQSSCTDTDNGAAVASNGWMDCAYLERHPTYCNKVGYDDTDFTMADMCCGCGGGQVKEQAEISALALEHLDLLNKLRAVGHTCPDGTSYGPNPQALQLDCRLWKAAYLHSQDMADRDYFDHDTLGTGESPWDRAEAQGISASGENIAMGYFTAEATLEGFKASNGHCNNMMKASYTLVGVGYGEGQGNRRWTQLFSRPLLGADEADVSCYPSSGGSGGSGRM